MSRKIEPRPGVEVYISEGGYICLSQEDGDHISGHSRIVLDPSIVPRVVEYLKETLDEYLDEFRVTDASEE